jgi:preprotein translocase subunit Sec63
MADLGYVPPVYDETVDYYSYLGISPNATRDEIRKAYIKKSLQIHPDKHPTAEYIERTKQFQVLQNISVCDFQFAVAWQEY